MTLQLHAHPFSSYCQKVLTALYENDTPFEMRLLEGSEAMRELAAIWPMKRFPVLVEGGRTVIEATSIIEYLDVHHPGPTRFIPSDRDAAIEVRMMDRFFDNYISTPQQKVVADALRPEGVRDPHGVEHHFLLRRRNVVVEEAIHHPNLDRCIPVLGYEPR